VTAAPGPSGDPDAAVTGEAWVRLSMVATAAVLVLFAAFPHRLEYPAHVLAGFGLAGVGTVVVRRRRGPGSDGSVLRLGEAAIVVAFAAIVGILADLTLTGPFDVLDVANTLMGSLLGVAAVAAAVPDRVAARPRPLAIAGVVLIAAGLVLRYPVQDTVKHWWWFG
jgi:hypothetical protein